MKHALLAIAILVGCKKSEPAPASDPAPTATEREGAAGSSAQGAAPAGPSGERRARMMKELDTNGDGVISDDERAAGHKKRIEGMRARLDTNGDGKLTPEELAAATGRMKFDNPTELDTNKDGDISADELDAAMKTHRGGRHGGVENGSGSAED